MHEFPGAFKFPSLSRCLLSLALSSHFRLCGRQRTLCRDDEWTANWTLNDDEKREEGREKGRNGLIRVERKRQEGSWVGRVIGICNRECITDKEEEKPRFVCLICAIHPPANSVKKNSDKGQCWNWLGSVSFSLIEWDSLKDILYLLVIPLANKS